MRGIKALKDKKLQHGLEGREYPINDTTSLCSFEPPTAFHHGGFLFNKTMVDKNMMVILFDSRVLGVAMAHGRKNARLRRGDVARMLKIPYKTLRKYELGQQIISDSILEKLLTYGFTLLYAKRTDLKQ